MLRSRQLLLAASLVAAGCSSAPNATDATPTSGPPATVVLLFPTNTATPPTTTPTEIPSPVETPAPLAEVLVSGPGNSIEVSGTALPTTITSAISSNGGELATTSAWDARFDTFGLPRVTGSQVLLVSASIEAFRTDAGWARTDALQWLFTDTRFGASDALLDAVATQAGLADWVASSESSVIDGADCTARSYTTSASATTWELSSCSYPKFAGMFALGVSRTGGFDAPPPVVDPTVNGVVAATGGRVESVSVVFDHPQGKGSVVTLTTDTVVAYDVGFETASAAVTAGPLAGWTVNPGEDSARLAGATGTAWVLGPETATFTSAGRVSL